MHFHSTRRVPPFELRYMNGEISVHPAASETAAAPVADVRVAVVEGASDAATNGYGYGEEVACQTVEEYELNPDAQKPGVGSGIQISLDALGVVIPVSGNNKRSDDRAVVRRDVKEATMSSSKEEKCSGNGNNKVLLSEVRRCYHTTIKYYYVIYTYDTSH